MEDSELHHPRDGAFTLMRHAVLSSPSTLRLITHLLVVSTNLLTAFAIALVMVAFGATFLIQCFSVICVIEKFIECFNEVAVTVCARMISLLLMKPCFSRGTVGERERMAASSTLVRVIVGCWWSSFAYAVPVDKLYSFYNSWNFLTIVVTQVWLQLLCVRVEDMYRRGTGSSSSSRESKRDRATTFCIVLLALGLLIWLISSALYKETSLETVVMLRNAIGTLCLGVRAEKFLISRMFSPNESVSSSYSYEDSSSSSSSLSSSSSHKKLCLDLFRILCRLVLNCCVLVAASEGNRMFLFLLVANDVIALSDPVVKIVDMAMYERHLKGKYPRLTTTEFAAVPSEETCPVCLEVIM